MSHHSEDDTSGMHKKLVAEAQALKLGATKSFPKGQLDKSDEGEIRIGITAIDGKVVLNFGKPVVWIGFDPMQAMEIGTLLIKRAQECA